MVWTPHLYRILEPPLLQDLQGVRINERPVVLKDTTEALFKYKRIALHKSAFNREISEEFRKGNVKNTTALLYSTLIDFILKKNRHFYCHPMLKIFAGIAFKFRLLPIFFNLCIVFAFDIK